MPTVVSREGAIDRMKRWHKKGRATLPPDGVGVQGHCMGAVGRAFLGRSSGFPSAAALVARAKAAGILRSGKPERGDIVLWTGGSKGYGHVGIAVGPNWFFGVDLPTTNRVGRALLSTPRTRWGLTYAGHVHPEDMQRVGWPPIPVDPPTKGTTVLVRASWSQKAPVVTHTHPARTLRSKGHVVRYVAVVQSDGHTWLRTRLGRYFLADDTQRGA